VNRPVTRIHFQPEQQAASRLPSPDLSRQDRVTAEAFRALLALQLARYWQDERVTDTADDAWALAVSLFRARMSPPVAAAGQAEVRSAGVAAYKAQGMEKFQQLKPYFLKAEQETGVPWQIQAAQWALETGWGRYTPKDLVTGRESHNLFGVKGTGPAGSVTAATVEYVNGQMVQTTAQFRAYHSEAESILEHARMLAGPRYRAALACGRDLKAWTEMLGPQHLGYATDPQYSQKLWQIITENGWHLA